MTEVSSPELTRLKRLGFALGWKHPFFMPGYSRINFEVNDKAVSTAMVSVKGTITFNSVFLKSLNDEEATGLIAHEICHLMLLHADRLGKRDQWWFNNAADMAINQGLKQSGIKLPNSALYPPSRFENCSTEELYDLISKKEINVPPKPVGPPNPAAGCGVEEAELGKITGEELRKWQEVAAQARAIGRESAEGLVKLMEVPPAKVKWKNLIRHSVYLALAMHGRDMQTWQKRCRRSGNKGPQFPGWTSTKPKIAIIIDTSGSMSDQVLCQAATEAALLATLSADVYLVLHDAEAYFADWVGANARPNDFRRRMTARGGTSFDGAYKKLAKAGPIDCVIHLTDGYCDFWPAKPPNCRYMIAAITGTPIDKLYKKPPTGARVVEVEIT